MIEGEIPSVGLLDYRESGKKDTKRCDAIPHRELYLPQVD
jgi:hypothetical protein